MLRCGRAYRNSTVAHSSSLAMQINASAVIFDWPKVCSLCCKATQDYWELRFTTSAHKTTMHTILTKGKSLFPCHSIPKDWSMAICIDVIELFIIWIYCQVLLPVIHTISLTCVLLCLSNGEWSVMSSNLNTTDCVLKKNVQSENDFSAGLLQLSLVQLRCHTAGCLCLVWITFYHLCPFIFTFYIFTPNIASGLGKTPFSLFMK